MRALYRRAALVAVVLVGVLLLAAASLLAARKLRGGEEDEGVSTIISTPTTAETSVEPPEPVAPPTVDKVSVTVRDRLSGKGVAGARVRIAGRDERADKHGIVLIDRPKRASYRVEVSARGYEDLRDRVRFKAERPWDTVYLWKPEWSMPLYGTTPQRTQAPAGHRAAAAAAHRSGG